MDENKNIDLEERARFYRMEVQRLDLSIEVAEPDLEDLSTLGAGSIGQVNAAVDKALGRTVAVKMLHPQFQMRSDQLERMVREAQAAAKLEHPNIVPVYSLGISPRRGVYFTMKRLKGDSLRSIITELSLKNPAYTRHYTWARRLSIFMRICQGMAYAHSKKVLHRDLKPENVRVGNFGEVTIIDWGLVRGVRSFDSEFGREKTAMHSSENAIAEEPSMDDVMQMSNPTMDGVFSGTPRYMSPEQANGIVSSLDVRSDIYALGVLLYELMTCYNPFYNKKTEDEILEAVRNGSYKSPRQYEAARKFPVELEKICLKAMSLNPENRYQSVSELLTDLYAHQEGRPVHAYKGTPITSLRRYFQRNPLKSVACLSIIMAILTFATIIYMWDLYSYTNCIRIAQENFQAAESLHSMIEAKDAEARKMRMPSEKNELTLMDIDTRYETSLFYLASVPAVLQYRSAVVELTERILEKRLQLDIYFSRTIEMQKHLENINRRYHGNLAGCSKSLKAVVAAAQHIINGSSNITLIEASASGTSLTIIPISNDEFTGHRSGKLSVSHESSQNLLNISLPQQNLALPKGEYIFLFQAPSLPQVKEHVVIGRHVVDRVYVDMPALIPDRTCYVPASVAYVGSISPDNPGVLVDIPAFFIGKYEVTFGEYFNFWKQQSDARKAELMPKISLQMNEAPFPAWDDDGKPAPNVSMDRPVVGISAAAADAYCSWLGKQVGRACRLPNEAEWEKAARGVNGRLYPWGNKFDAEMGFFANNDKAHAKYGFWAPGGSFPHDCSLYGAMDMAGNVREWTSSVFADMPSQRIIKGASSSTSSRYLPLGRAHDAPVTPSDVGFRVLFPLYNQDVVNR